MGRALAALPPDVREKMIVSTKATPGAISYPVKTESLDYESVTTQLRTLLPVLRDQPVLTAELGRHARQRVHERYTLSRNIDAIEQLYVNLLRSGSLAA